MNKYKVRRWSRVIEDQTVEATDYEDAEIKANARDEWSTVNVNVVDIDVEKL